MPSSIVRNLFDGAITAIMPDSLIDASELRQVPDTQEVFLYPDSSVSVIVEILQRVEPVQFSDAIRFHFDSLAHDNSAQSSEVHDVTVVPNDRGDATPSAIILRGIQYVPKFNRTTPDDVQVLMCLFRVETKQVDLVVTFNVPTKSGDGGAVGEDGWNAAKSDFENMARSLQIVDFGLFA